MDVRNSTLVDPVVEHNGTTPVWYLVEPREMQAITNGGFLELVNEFEVRAGGAVDPHTHPTHEFYFVQTGRGMMTIEDETREVGPGDLIYIPPNLVHSIRPEPADSVIRCFCFAVAESGAGPINYTDH